MMEIIILPNILQAFPLQTLIFAKDFVGKFDMCLVIFNCITTTVLRYKLSDISSAGLPNTLLIFKRIYFFLNNGIILFMYFSVIYTHCCFYVTCMVLWNALSKWRNKTVQSIYNRDVALGSNGGHHRHILRGSEHQDLCSTSKLSPHMDHVEMIKWLPGIPHTVFFKTRGHLLVWAPPRLASSGLTWPCLAMPCHALSCLAWVWMWRFFIKYEKWDSYGGVVLMRFLRYSQSD